MALTFSEISRTIFGNKRIVVTEITFDSSYATGGEALTPANLGLASIDALIPSGVAAAAAGAAAVAVKFDRTNNKLQAFRVGAIAASGDPETLAAASLAEVSNTISLAGLKVVAVVVGS